MKERICSLLAALAQELDDTDGTVVAYAPMVLTIAYGRSVCSYGIDQSILCCRICCYDIDNSVCCYAIEYAAAAERMLLRHSVCCHGIAYAAMFSVLICAVRY